MFLQFLYALFLDIKDTFEHVNATVNFILPLGCSLLSLSHATLHHKFEFE